MAISFCAPCARTIRSRTTRTAGRLIRYMGHHPNRPGHLRFILAKDGYRTLVSRVFDADSPWLDEDSVFT